MLNEALRVERAGLERDCGTQTSRWRSPLKELLITCRIQVRARSEQSEWETAVESPVDGFDSTARLSRDGARLVSTEMSTEMGSCVIECDSPPN